MSNITSISYPFVGRFDPAESFGGVPNNHCFEHHDPFDKFGKTESQEIGLQR